MRAARPRLVTVAPWVSAGTDLRRRAKAPRRIATTPAMIPKARLAHRAMSRSRVACGGEGGPIPMTLEWKYAPGGPTEKRSD